MISNASAISTPDSDDSGTVGQKVVDYELLAAVVTGLERSVQENFVTESPTQRDYGDFAWRRW